MPLWPWALSVVPSLPGCPVGSGFSPPPGDDDLELGDIAVIDTGWLDWEPGLVVSKAMPGLGWPVFLADSYRWAADDSGIQLRPALS